MAQRIVRAKRKITRRPTSRTGCPATPSCPTGSGRCSPSSTWSSTRATPRPRGDDLVRADLCAEAIRLGPAARRADARRARGASACSRCCCSPSPAGGARTAADGSLVLLADQDRSPVGPDADRRGPRPRAACLRRNQPGPVPAPGRDQRRAHATRRRPPTPTGRRSSRSTTSSSVIVADARRRAQPGGRGRRGRRPGARRRSEVDGLDLDSTTRSTPPGPTCWRRLGRPDEAAAAYDGPSH